MSYLQREAIRGVTGNIPLAVHGTVELIQAVDAGGAIELSINSTTGASAMLRRATDDNLTYETELWVALEGGSTGEVVPCAQVGTVEARVAGLNSAGTAAAIAAGDALTFKALAAINNLYYDSTESCLCKAVTGDIIAGYALETVTSGAAVALSKVRLVPQVAKA